MKEKYTKPVLEIEQFKTDDVITTSIDQTAWDIAIEYKAMKMAALLSGSNP